MDFLQRPQFKLVTLSLLVKSLRLRQPAPEHSQTCVVFFWHEEVFGAYKYFAGTQALAMVSPSRDGRLAKALCQAMSIDVVSASSNEKPISGLRTLVRKASDYRFILFAADGPRGPRQQINPGAIWLARKLQLPLVAMRFGLSGRRLSSWDRMLIPYPLSKVHPRSSTPELLSGNDTQATIALYQQRMQQLQWTPANYS